MFQLKVQIKILNFLHKKVMILIFKENYGYIFELKTLWVTLDI